ncbi:hypothetical protein F3Y22_tig00113145pilonHSYRG00109 [Hibiscus syriacus]|uniref:RNA-directed DNA polymerase n=1 Tax=Hibiscus syriacus TaxID=106335 RepID=A0A6A2WQD3_HIBSY|nr:hypothetical protein F3Y22_tig00113145pilonHSYRG00109 [Hibiscus syriacus]
MAPQHGDVGGSEGNEPQKCAKKRAPLRDVLASLQEKLTRLECSMTEARVVLGMLEFVDLERLGSIDLDKLDSLDSIKEEVPDSLNELDARTTDRGDSLEAMIMALRKEVEELKSEATFENSAATVVPKALGDIPKPEKFKGSRSAQDVENFLWGLDQYFAATGITEDAKKVNITSVYLSEVTLMWWRRRCNDVKRGTAAIATWEEFQADFKEQFYPEYAEDEARSKLRRLNQEGSLREHVRKFRGNSGDRDRASRSDKDSSGSERSSNSKHFDKKDKPIIQCYNCKGQGHLARDCPQRNKLSAIKEKDGEDSDTLKLGSILSTMEVKKGRKKKGLMFVDVNVAGQKQSALVDTDASELFMSEPVAKRLGLHVEKANGSIKTVNTEKVPIMGVAKGIELTVGGWSGRETIKVIPLDDFDFVLGLILVSQGSGLGSKVLSAIQFSKAVHTEEPTFLAILVCDEPATTKEVPDVGSHVLAEFKDVMPDELPKKLAPKREVDHKIELVPNAEPPARAPYRMAPPELEKHDGSLRMCIDYRALNKLKVKNKYPIPHIADLFDQFGGARWFTKLDLRLGYYQVRIAEGDELKTTCLTMYGSYEYLVMPFGLMNAPATFCTLMNKVLQSFLDRFVVVYLDDIIIYSKTLEEHVEHLKQVFLVLRNNELYVKEEKFSFAQTEVPFLGHIIGGGMDRDKIRAIEEWKVPTKVTELRSFLGKDKRWDWSPKCPNAFDELKHAMISEPVLVLPDHTKSFEVFTDASDVVICGVLMQEGHPIAYENRKLNETERRYTVHEKEMMAVVHCLRTWQHYLLGSKFIVFTENVANSYFLTQKKLSPKQARWQEFLAEFDLSFEYKSGKMRERIKEGLSHDPMATSLMELATEAEHYYWPHMGNDVEAYVKTCLVCQQDKIEQKKPAGLLQPLSIPERTWESLSMDFIVCLPVTDGVSSIMVVIDRISKYGTFIPASKVCPAEEAARLFLKHVELFKLMGSSLNFSTSVHPQTYGQTERVNVLVETYFRHYVSATQLDWPKLLDIAQFSYNLQRSETTNQSPFEIVTGQQPLTPNAIATGYKGPNPTAYQFAKEWQEQHELARACLHKAGKRTKKWADRKRRDINFEVGDLVLAKLSGILRNPYHKGLVQRYEGPFKVLKRVGIMAYRLELPPTIKAHPVFHVSLLKPYHQDKEELDRGKSHRVPVGVKVSYEKEVEAIHAERAVHRVGHRPRHEYLVQWKGLPESEGSWEPSKDYGNSEIR